MRKFKVFCTKWLFIFLYFPALVFADNIQLIYDQAIADDCNYYKKNYPVEQCLADTERRREERGLDHQLEEQKVQEAKEWMFEDGTFKLYPGAKEYRYIATWHSIWRPSPLVERDHFLLYFNPEMTKMEHVDLQFRHGPYGPYVNSDHEVVLMVRNSATIEEVGYQVYFRRSPSNPMDLHWEYSPFKEPNFKLYRYKLRNFDKYVLPNYTAAEKAPDAEPVWYLGGKGHWETIESQSRSAPGLGNLGRNGTVSGDFEADLEIGFGWKAYILVRFNDDGTVDFGNVWEDYGYLFVEQITRLYPSDADIERFYIPAGEAVTTPELEQSTLTATGWIPSNPDFNPDNLETGDPRLPFAKTSTPDGEKYVCRFQKDYGNGSKTYYGYVSTMGRGGFICFGGGDISVLDNNRRAKPIESELHNFEWLSLRTSDPKKSGLDATDAQGRRICHLVNVLPFYGVGYLNSQKQCQQESNVIWANGKHWRFSRNWNTFKFK